MTQENLSPKIKLYLPIILATAIFMQMLDSTILNTSLPAIAKDLNESPLHMQNAIISYVLTIALLMPISGYLADKFGTKRIFILSLFLFALGSLFCSLSQNLNQLVLSRVLQGVGGSLMTPVGRLTLINSFPKRISPSHELCDCSSTHRPCFRSLGRRIFGGLFHLALDLSNQYSHRPCGNYIKHSLPSGLFLRET